MLNLNAYRERAAYEGEAPDGADADVAGREAYARYAAVALPTLARLGAQILWHAEAGQTVVGERERGVRRGDRGLVPEPRRLPRARHRRRRDPLRSSIARPASSARRSSAATPAPSPTLTGF